MFFYLFSQIMNYCFNYCVFISRDSESDSDSDSDSDSYYGPIYILDDILDIDDTIFYSEN